MNGVHTAMTNTRDTPVEAFERAYPMRVRRYELRTDSGGAGAAPGGDGIVREIEMLEAGDGVAGDRTARESQPWGLAGGAPGAVGENWLLPGGDETRAQRAPRQGHACGCDAGDVAAHPHAGRRRLRRATA